jgi:hypothetical protein
MIEPRRIHAWVLAGGLALSACATLLRPPDGAIDYACVNTDIRLRVPFSRDAARLEQDGLPAIDLMAAPTSRGFRYGGLDAGVELHVSGDKHVRMARTGDRPLFCEVETFVPT